MTSSRPPIGGAPRRRIAAWLLILLGLAAVLAAGWRYRTATSRGGDSPPTIPRGDRSVVLITLDTTRPDRLEPYGATNVATPALQRLAERGVTFDHAYAVAPITLVAHTSILTGLVPPQHGVRNNGLHHVEDEVETLAERLRDRGYATGAFVSAAVLERRYNLDQGFDVYDDDLSEGRERHPRMVADRPAEFTVRRAAAWLDDLEAERRFFLWVHFYDPHASYSPPPPWRDDYRGRLYDGEIAYMDAQIGRLLRHPRLGGDTAVVVLGDHGESLGEHGEQTHALLAYDATLHTPFIVDLPGGPAGTRIAETVSQVDLVPTVLDLLGSRIPDDLAGRSLMPLLEGREALPRRGIYAETWLPYYTYGWAKLRVWRHGRHKWIESPTPELYDTRRDPRELSNVAAMEPGLAHDLGRDLEAYLATMGDDEREAGLALDNEAREKLRSLGYLSVGSAKRQGADARPDPKSMIDLHTGLERARFLIRDRLYPQAETELRAVLRRDRANLAAMIDLAAVLAEQDRIDEAVGVVEGALDIDPDYPRLHWTLAGLESRRGDDERALALYDVALRLDPRSLEARLQKAFQLHRMRRVDDAESLLGETLEANPEVARVQAAHAQMVELRQGRFEAAEARLRAAIERDPFLVSAWRGLGEALERQGRVDEAIDAYRRGLERASDDPELHAALGVLLASRGEREAEAHLREAVRLAPRSRPAVRVALGAWLAERRRFDEAHSEYDKVLAAHPRHPGARNNRAIALYQTGDLDAAEQELITLIEQHPNHADAHNNLAAIALGRREFERAESHARESLAWAPSMPEAWNNLGLALAGEGRDQAARDAFERALALQPDYWQAKLNLGRALIRAEAWSEAEAMLGDLVRQRPQLADAHLELGELFAGPLDDPGRARAHWNAFLRHAPEHPRAPTIRQAIDDLDG